MSTIMSFPPAPMLAQRIWDLPKQSNDYATEIKWDGLRAIGSINNDSLQLFSRQQLDITKQYPELQALAKNQHRLIIDGEIVIFDHTGRQSFSQLQQRMNLHAPAAINKLKLQMPVMYIIFDLLSYDGQSLINQPYTIRRDHLLNLDLVGDTWLTPKHHLNQAAALAASSRHLGLEGIVFKHLESPYLPGQRSSNWLKLKHLYRQPFVIGGWTVGAGSRSHTFGSLLLGYYQHESDQSNQKRLIYAGACGTGFNQPTLTQLSGLLQQLASEHNPFTINPPKPNVNYIKPLIVANIAFMEWTSNHTLRQPVFLGLQLNKLAAQVVYTDEEVV